MVRFYVAVFCIHLLACNTVKKIEMPVRTSTLSGTDFYKKVVSMNWQQRDSVAVKEIFAGNIPSFLAKFERVKIEIKDSISGNIINAYIFVSTDYLCIGTDEDWARIPLTPMSAQQIADRFHCFLPTKKIVDEIYNHAKVKLEPIPMYAFRDSSITMWQHHLMIEGQRKSRKGLIAGIKKDIILTDRLEQNYKPNRVAIYGWHKLDGKPIQSIYTGHVNWYVDYSHGVRLIYNKVLINKKWIHYEDVLNDKALRNFLCDELLCNCFRYSFKS